MTGSTLPPRERPQYTEEERDFLRKMFGFDPDELDEPDEDEEVWDRRVVPQSHLYRSRHGSGSYWARVKVWQERCDAMNSDLDLWNPSHLHILLTILNLCAKAGTDLLTLNEERLAAFAGTTRWKVRQAVPRLVEDGWLTIHQKGTKGVRKGKGGSGRATVYGITGRGIPPQAEDRQGVPSRRANSKVVGRPLGGRAQPARVSPPAKESKIPLNDSTPRYMVSRRVGTVGVSNDADAGVSVVTEPSTGGDAVGVSNVKRTPSQDQGAALDSWLRAYLTTPSRPKDVVHDAVEAGFNARSVYRSAKRIGAVPVDISYPGRGRGKPPIRATLWQLPAPVPEKDVHEDVEPPERADPPEDASPDGDDTAARNGASSQVRSKVSPPEWSNHTPWKRAASVVTAPCKSGHRFRMFGWRQLANRRLDADWPPDRVLALAPGRGLVGACSVCLCQTGTCPVCGQWHTFGAQPCGPGLGVGG